MRLFIFVQKNENYFIVYKKKKISFFYEIQRENNFFNKTLLLQGFLEWTKQLLLE